MPDHEHLASLADDELLRKIGQGCADCFGILFHRYCRQVFSVSYRILRDKSETEDILQEVFLSIYLQQEKYDPARGSVRTWILQFAYFKALLRRRYLRIRNFYKHSGGFCCHGLDRRLPSGEPLALEVCRMCNERVHGLFYDQQLRCLDRVGNVRAHARGICRVLCRSFALLPHFVVEHAGWRSSPILGI